MKRVLIAAVAVLMMTSAALADAGHGGGHGPEGPGPRDGGEPIIGADGSAYIVSSVLNASNADVTKIQAISSSGTTKFTVTLDFDANHLTLSGSNLIAVSEVAATTTTAATSKLTGISSSTGAVSWTLALDGRAGAIEPFSGGTYVVVVKPSATSGALPSRTLIAVSSSGTILFSVPLT